MAIKISSSANIYCENSVYKANRYISSILFSIYNVRKDYNWVNQQKNLWEYKNLPLPKTKYLKKALEKGYNPFYLKLIKL